MAFFEAKLRDTWLGSPNRGLPVDFCRQTPSPPHFLGVKLSKFPKNCGPPRLIRLISGYAEIERTYKGGRYDFLKKAESGTMARAKIFMDRYFEDGAIYNGHLLGIQTYLFSE